MILLFSLENWPIFVCGDDGLAVTSTTSSRNGKRQSMIPLRDNTDYEQAGKDDYDAEYDDEYETFDGEQYPDVAEDNDVQHKILLKTKNAKENVSDRDQIEARTQQMETSTVVVSTISTIGSSAVESCPKECSCLNDFMDCIRMNLDHLPHVPQWVTSL